MQTLSNLRSHLVIKTKHITKMQVNHASVTYMDNGVQPHLLLLLGLRKRTNTRNYAIKTRPQVHNKH
jgi:hypothetical protein